MPLVQKVTEFKSLDCQAECGIFTEMSPSMSFTKRATNEASVSTLWLMNEAKNNFSFLQKIHPQLLKKNHPHLRVSRLSQKGISFPICKLLKIVNVSVTY